MRIKYKVYQFSKKVAQDLADELGMDHVPTIGQAKRTKKQPEWVP